MSRSADYTIQGFLYQFNQSLAEILDASEDAVITIEGIVEDIEVLSFSGLKAIQCKYHETRETYTPSLLYHPLLQMMKHFKSNPTANITYYLFAHFPNNPSISITAVEIQQALSSSNKDLAKLIDEVNGVNIQAFLNVFQLRVTPSYDHLAKENHLRLEALGFDKSEVTTLFYPNSIQIIADLSIKHDPLLRVIRKSEFLNTLRTLRSTAISYWTLALSNRKQLLLARKRQLQANLNQNVRLRYLVFFPRDQEDLKNHIVIFIKDFLRIYHHKTAHINTPVFVMDVSILDLEDIARRLHNVEVIPNLGYLVKDFVESHFFREPIVQRDKKEFHLRLIRWEEFEKVKPAKKPDDLFLVGKADISTLNLQDVNVEVLDVENFGELEYLLGMKDGY